MNENICTIYVPNKVQTNNQVSGDLAQTWDERQANAATARPRSPSSEAADAAAT
jgi:hypothetical protein